MIGCMCTLVEMHIYAVNQMLLILVAFGVKEASSHVIVSNINKKVSLSRGL